MTKLSRLAFVLALVVAGCSSQRASDPPPPSAPPLRVGVSPDTAPYVFFRGDQIAGLEIDFAVELAHAFGRPLQLVPLQWQDQIPALVDGRTDVIMSGMSITPAREGVVAFAEPYLRTTLQALIRREDVERYPTPDALIASSPRIGVQKGTTGEAFVRERRPHENIVLYTRTRDAVIELRNRRIDVFVSDAPVIAAMASIYEGELTAFPQRFGAESIAWAFRPQDGELRAASDQVLAAWKKDGTLAHIFAAWPLVPPPEGGM